MKPELQIRKAIAHRLKELLEKMIEFDDSTFAEVVARYQNEPAVVNALGREIVDTCISLRHADQLLNSIEKLSINTNSVGSQLATIEGVDVAGNKTYYQLYSKDLSTIEQFMEGNQLVKAIKHFRGTVLDGDPGLKASKFTCEMYPFIKA